MKQVALKRKGSESADAQFEAARELMLAGGASMVYHFMSDEDVDRIMKHPHVAIASDSSLLTLGEGVPHPRGYGNNARVLGEYVRAAPRDADRGGGAEDDVPSRRAVPLRTAAGSIKEGYAADLVVFDPAAVARSRDVRAAARLRVRHPVRVRQWRAGRRRRASRPARARARC